jgi:hypothetical protein
MNLTLNVLLPADRTKLGRFSLIDGSGQQLLGDCPVLGKADNAMALEHKNAERDPMKPFGDTPLGVYVCVVIPASPNQHSYGPNRRLLLVPKSGPCVVAEDPPACRRGIEWHGGGLNSAFGYWGGLRPTDGCLRSHDEDIARILAFYDQNQPAEFLANITEAG